MLLIAIPKSASTSLMNTLAEAHGVQGKQKFFKEDRNIIDEYSVLARHSDVKEYTETEIDDFCTSNGFYKQHIPPTDNNLQLLSAHKKVILLRDVNEIIHAYRRAQEKRIHNRWELFEGCHTEDEWFDRAKEVGLINELENFYSKWKNDTSDKLVIYYNELISDSVGCVVRISNYFDLPIDHLSKVELQKHRYSGHNKLQRIFYKLTRRIRKLLDQ